MLHLTRRTTVKWTATTVSISLIVYVGTYVALGTRREYGGRYERRFYIIEYMSPTVASLYRPLAASEAAMRGYSVAVWARTGTRDVGWFCDPWDRPRYIVYVKEPLD